jgi:hypothetical protein
VTPAPPNPENSKAAQLARKMGLDFTCDQRICDGHAYVRFAIKFPEVRGVPEPVQNTITPSSAPVDVKRFETPEAKTFQAYVAKVTAWRKKVAPWTFDPAPPGETGIIVAAELGTFGDRFRVRAINKKNRAAVAKFMDPQAMARRVALVQTEPNAALRALNDTLNMYGVKKPNAETLALRHQLEKASAIVALDGVEPVGGIQ